jgi:type IV secretory pathway VirD2 relaxase
VPCATEPATVPGSGAMVERDDDDIRPRPGPPRDQRRVRAPRFINRVLKASSKAGGAFGGRLPYRRARGGASVGRGHIAAQLAGRGLDHRARRVVIKTRLVNLKRAGLRSTEKHLRYIERDGVTREGGRGRLYGPDTDQADGADFDQRGRDDRHQFRFIISPDDALEIDGLKSFIRGHMAQMQRDLDTKLDWVAVDHWDTDNPHTHVVLRGKDDHGTDLVIARSYIAFGMRRRASELATQWLGRRSEREIRRGLEREVRQDRWTDLDRALTAGARDGIVNLRDVPGELGRRKRRVVLIGRLQYLAELGLAEKQRGAKWLLRPEAARTLRTMGERGDIARTLQRTMGDRARGR